MVLGRSGSCNPCGSTHRICMTTLSSREQYLFILRIYHVSQQVLSETVAPRIVASTCLPHTCGLAYVMTHVHTRANHGWPASTHGGDIYIWRRRS